MTNEEKANERAARVETMLCGVSAIFTLLTLLDGDAVQQQATEHATDFTTALVNIGRVGERLTNEAIGEVMEIPTELGRRDADAG
jgi:hypothetical protein